jgi:hypothetical protein
MSNNTEQTYTIADDSWNPWAIENLTEADIFSLPGLLGIDPDKMTIDALGRVFYDGKKIGQANE